MTHLIQVNPLLFEPGDRLTLEDFLARWDKMPNLKFAELIDGVVHMPSPLSYDHSLRDGQMQLLLGIYAARTGVCEILPNATWLMLESAPQPDIALRLLPDFGGKTSIRRKLAAGAPELVAEICYSSRSLDLGPKLALYERAGVPEYVTVLLEEQRVEWRVLEGGSFRLSLPDDAGVLQSLVFPGLWLDERAFWAADSQRTLDVLNAGIESPECESFLKRLGRS